MNFTDFFLGLTNVFDWIENVIINGLLGNGFKVILDGVNVYTAFKPLVDAFTAIFAMFGAA
ncbi:MAG: hypothetical protein FWC27_11480 [Firmicutes bacterium]|nr:hypothetical protein [Bacillota bacterium]